jgi:hypothetical protein
LGSLNSPMAAGRRTRNSWPGNATNSASTAIAAEKDAAPSTARRTTRAVRVEWTYPSARARGVTSRA